MAHADARSVTYNAPQGLNDSDLKRFFDVDYEKHILVQFKYA